MQVRQKSVHGRGAASNPANRFEPLHLEQDEDLNSDETSLPTTQFFKDASCSVIAFNDSPDIGYSASLNPYRGCEHGCIYCYARPTHEYLGFSAGLDFESKILVKPDAPALLRRELARPTRKPQVIALSGVTDCYQPIERKLQLTRRCIAVLLEFRNPVGIVTKNHLITRDLDLLRELARFDAVMVNISVTTLDASLAAQLEPRTSQPRHRLEAIERLRAAGVPTGVLVAPVIPALTDHELPAILKAAAKAGAQYAGYTPLRLPLGVGALFADWLTRHIPLRREKILNRISTLRGGKLNDSRFFTRMKGEGIFAQQMEAIFKVTCGKLGLSVQPPPLSTAAFRKPPSTQMELFDR